MNRKQIISLYKVDNLRISEHLFDWMRSNHAGETGAVWIYKGALCAFWSPTIRLMARKHIKTEICHLICFEHLVPKKKRSKLIFIWKAMGFGLGIIPTIFGHNFFCLTVNAIETFVVGHYNQQINYLKQSNTNSSLLAFLQKCCKEEVSHKLEAANCIFDQLSIVEKIWFKIIKSCSAFAVKVAKKY